MMHFSLLLIAIVSIFGYFSVAASVPLQDSFGKLSLTARSVLERATPVAPHFVIYGDKYESGGAPAVSDIEGYNVFALAFLDYYGSADQAQVWQELTSDQRSSAKAEYEAANIALIVSLFGSTETPTSSGYDPIDTANTMAAWVIEYDLDGVDVDYEDFNAFDAGTGAAEQWLGNFTTQLRTQLPVGQYILTHAPVAPWFSPSMWGGGGYLWVNSVVGDMIDWYNVQFYNQGETEYTTCEGLLYNSSSTWPQSALFQISASGVSLDKLVIGKPATTSDANNGYMNASYLASCVEEAAAAGWDAGIMVWQYPDAGSAWIETVRGDVWPYTATTVATTATPTSSVTATTSPSATMTSPASSGNCDGVTAWASGTAYNGGAEVTYDGYLWTASYWTENDTPGGSAGVWVNDGACETSAQATAAPAAVTPTAAAIAA